jgi:hypothetical protein
MAAHVKSPAPRSNRDKAAAAAAVDVDQPTLKFKANRLPDWRGSDKDFVETLTKLLDDKLAINTAATSSYDQSQATGSGLYENSMSPAALAAPAPRPPSPTLSTATTPVLGMPPSLCAGDEVESHALTTENLAAHVAAEEQMRNQIAKDKAADAGDEDDEMDGKSPSAMERELESALSAAGKFDLRKTAAGRL